MNPNPAPLRGRQLATMIALIVAITYAFSAIQGTRRADAQVPRVVATAHLYRHALVTYTQMDQTLTDWEAKGWEAFQIVPIANPNPATGTPMQVAVVFRRHLGK
jgi:hypothetical protein